MTTMTDSPVGTPTESFRLSMLLNDTRYRSLTFQFIALVAIIAFMAFVGGNLVRNLAEAGLNISYAFLAEPAGYDINQRPIEYDSQSSHGRAAIVGLLNTLIVAFLACVTATVFGVIAGVLRLSNNWIVAKIMAFYVEIFRNVPVLIWILIIFSIMINAMPKPRAFLGDEPTASKFLGMAFTNRGVFAPAPETGVGFGVLLVVALLSLACVYLYRAYARKSLYERGKLLPTFWPSLAILVIPSLLVYFAFSLTVGAERQAFVFASDAADGQSIATLIEGEEAPKVTLCEVEGLPSSALAKHKIYQVETDLLRTDETPNALARAKFKTSTYGSLDEAKAGFDNEECNLLVAPQSMVENGDLGLTAPASVLTDTVAKGGPIVFERPYQPKFNFEDGLQIRGSLIALWFALAIYTGAFIAENVRAGILAISKGQTEAAGALGLRPNRIMSLVVLPQALRVIIPPLISQYLNITKNSSLAIAVGYMDVTGTLGGITLLQTGRAIETILLLMLFYLTISLLISAVMNVFNNRMKLKER